MNKKKKKNKTTNEKKKQRYGMIIEEKGPVRHTHLYIFFFSSKRKERKKLCISITRKESIQCIYMNIKQVVLHSKYTHFYADLKRIIFTEFYFYFLIAKNPHKTNFESIIHRLKFEILRRYESPDL